MQLKTIQPLIQHIADAPPTIAEDEFEQRIASLFDAAGADWVVVYGDREHCANLVWLTNFDPRFEEALLVIGPAKRALVVGNEGIGYVSQARVKLDVALCQSFSLMGQPRDTAPRLDDVLRQIGLAEGARVAVVGWKYLEARETDDDRAPAFVPTMIERALRNVVGARGELTDATSALMHPSRGLRSRNSAAQIAAFEWAAMRASSAVWRMVRGARPGMTEHQAAARAMLEGDLLSCHLMMNGSRAQVVGLRSPTSRALEKGDGVSCAVGLWGSLCCRAGVLSDAPDESFVSAYGAPYFGAIAAWHRALQVGVSGGDVHRAVHDALAGAPFQPALNPGHLISFDEWLHSPIRPGSDERLATGMVLQCDIIPTPMPDSRAMNCEDTVALADAALRAELATAFPDVWRRIVARRDWMRGALGIALADDVLPLSCAPAALPLFWLAPDLVCAE